MSRSVQERPGASRSAQERPGTPIQLTTWKHLRQCLVIHWQGHPNPHALRRTGDVKPRASRRTASDLSSIAAMSPWNLLGAIASASTCDHPTCSASYAMRCLVSRHRRLRRQATPPHTMGLQTSQHPQTPCLASLRIHGRDLLLLHRLGWPVSLAHVAKRIKRLLHHSSSVITPDHPKGRCPFWANLSSILGGSRDHLGVILGSSFKGSRGVPNIKN